MDTTDSLGYWLRRQRKALDLTQKKLAQQVCCSVSAIKKMEADARRPSRQMAERLALVLSISPDDHDRFLAMACGKARADTLLLATTPQPPRHSLPAAATTFVGRADELRTLRQLLAQHRHITITAPGGMGKTKLALEAARGQTDRFRDGVWFVPLATVSGAEELPAAIATALNIQFMGRAAPMAQLINHLYARHRLLLLDNFEHLLPQGSAMLVMLLQHCPDLILLVTSRERLNTRTETVLVLTRMSEAEGITLFQARAAQANPDLTETPARREAARQINEIVGGLPLGIELAAAWARLLEPEEIAAELSNNLGLLRATLVDVPERQQDLRVIFETSWYRLDTPSQRALCRMSVFTGDFDSAAAIAISGASLEVLLNLADKSLLQHNSGRFSLHPLIRQYSREKLEIDPAEEFATAARHAAYYTERLSRNEQCLNFGEQPDTVCLDKIQRDLDNIRQAWRWTAQHGPVESLVSNLAVVSMYFDVRGSNSEMLSMLIEARAHLTTNSPPLCESVIHSFLGFVQSRLGNFIEAAANINHGLSILKTLDAPEHYAMALLHQGMLEMYTDQPERAKVSFLESVSLFRGLRHRRGIMYVCSVLAMVLAQIGEYDEAVAYSNEGLTHCREIGSGLGLSRALQQFGYIQFARGNFAEALEIQEQGLAAAKAANDTAFIPLSLVYLGMAQTATGDADGAASNLRDALQTSVRHQNLMFSLAALGAMGLAAAAKGDDSWAVTLLTFTSNASTMFKKFYLGIPEKALAELKSRMSADDFEAAQACGATITMEAIAAKALD